MNITSGVIKSALKIIIYGPEGIGKSTFAAQFPKPLFIDTEGSTNHMNVRRLPKPQSFAELTDEIRFVKTHPHECDTLVIDTADWAEQLAAKSICDASEKKSIEDFGYGKGFILLQEEFGRMLNLLEDVISVGINVVVTAHAQIVKFEQPDERGAYDKWELKLGIKKTEKRTAALLKEWADMVLFANYKIYTVKANDDSKSTKKKAISSGMRVMYASHHSCWDAKNRFGLPDEMPFDFKEIAHIIPVADEYNLPDSPQTEPVSNLESFKAKINEFTEDEVTSSKQSPQQEAVPSALAALMNANNVTVDDIQAAVESKGYFPAGTPISNYGMDFINGCLIGAWEQVYSVILSIKNNK